MPDVSRTYPRYPIPCAAGIVMQSQHVLLVQRGREPNFGRWTFPGGAMEVGETSQECAVREVKEETGLGAEILSVVEVVDRVFKDEAGRVKYQYLIVDYLARPVGGTLAPADDVMQAIWLPFEEALTLDLAPPTGEVLRKAIRMWQEREH